MSANHDIRDWAGYKITQICCAVLLLYANYSLFCCAMLLLAPAMLSLTALAMLHGRWVVLLLHEAGKSPHAAIWVISIIGMVVIHMSLGACVHVSNAKRSVASGESITIKIV